MDNKDPAAEAILRQFAEAEAKHQLAKANYSIARDALLALSVQEPGVTTTIIGSTLRAEVEYPPKKKWDSDALTALYGAAPPHHVKQTLSIDEREYKRLPQGERDNLSSCFSEVVGTPKIELFSLV